MDKGLDKEVPNFTKSMIKDLKKYVKNLKSPKGLNSVDIGSTQALTDKMLIGHLIGFIENYHLDKKADFKVKLNPDSIFSLPFDEAIKALSEMYPNIDEAMDKSYDYLTSMVKDVKELTNLTIQKKIFQSLSSSIESGLGFKGWKKKFLKEIDTTDYYWEVVYRQNVFTAYSKGNYDQQRANINNKPYGLYNAIDDSRITDLCESLNGTIEPLESPFWATYTPPNHFGCRSSVIALSYAEVVEYGLIDDLDKKTEYPAISSKFNQLPWETMPKNIVARKAEVEKLKELVV